MPSDAVQCSLKQWLDNHSTFSEWDEDLRVAVAASLKAVDFEDAEELVDLEEKEIAAVVAPLSKRRARLFREAIAASGDRKNDN